ncbi:MAG: hypothetical protein EPO22_07210 [Dehalococcoidia bacterium]|nr:MAG: hypothetical protein EPO22_07210 [Dehalococcoidia bacterium]
MTSDTKATGIVEQNGALIGPYRRPRNLAATQRGSIHDDATAQKLGFRSGTVAGSIHMEQFPPVLIAALGRRWFETGSLSCYFRNATTDGEPVRVLAQKPAAADADGQINVWMERDDGTQVLEGTASAGTPPEPSMLRRKLAEPRDAGEMRMLAHLSPGEETAPVRVRLADEKEAAPRLAAITEPLDWYTSASPWGGAIVGPGLLVHLMVQAQAGLKLGRAQAVGLYGAIEIRHVAGPVFSGREYDVTARILATGQTPKTEYLWYETSLREAGGAAEVAGMTMMLRFMKASSPLWASS